MKLYDLCLEERYTKIIFSNRCKQMGACKENIGLVTNAIQENYREKYDKTSICFPKIIPVSLIKDCFKVEKVKELLENGVIQYRKKPFPHFVLSRKTTNILDYTFGMVKQNTVKRVKIVSVKNKIDSKMVLSIITVLYQKYNDINFILDSSNDLYLSKTDLDKSLISYLRNKQLINKRNDNFIVTHKAKSIIKKIINK